MFKLLFRGSFGWVMCKLVALIVLLALVAAGLGLDETAGAIIVWVAIPIALFGFWMIVRAPFNSGKKEKKKS